jgi:hypothetical protein
VLIRWRALINLSKSAQAFQPDSNPSDEVLEVVLNPFQLIFGDSIQDRSCISEQQQQLRAKQAVPPFF